MGHLLNGVWKDGNLDTRETAGAFVRRPATFRNWVTRDGSAGPSGKAGFRAESGRYHLYVSLACPWAHRTIIFRTLKDLAPHIGMSVVHPDMLSDGWSFRTDFAGATGDQRFGLPLMRDIYLRADPVFTGRVTVPVLWDNETGTIVSNESSEIIRMFNSAFDDITDNRLDLWPAGQRDAIEEVNARIYDGLNNGVYKAGFAATQSAYAAAALQVFETLDWLEDRLATQRFLMGDRLTEADWRLFPTLIRFDAVYHGHFKCNRARIVDYPNMWAYLRDLFQRPGIAETVNLDHITRHYYFSHESINPHRIVPIGPKLDLWAPHGRENLSRAASPVQAARP